MSEENSLGEMLSTVRRRMGWTQQELADKFDTPINRVTVIRWEKNIQRPSDSNIRELITILGLNEEQADALNRASGQPTFRIRILPLRNQLFTGREGQLELVSQLLKESSSVALSGLAGIGKTQLALEYAHRFYPDVYRAVFWVDAADQTMLVASYDRIARKLELPEQHERDQHLRIQAVKGWLEDHTNWLLIMDNADDLPHARSFFPSAHDGHILLTTRTQIVGKVAMKIEVEKLEPEEGQLFLLRRSDTSKVKAALNDFATDTREAAIRVVELLDGHPLALDQAGAYIEGGVSLTDYIDHYNEQRRCLLKDRGPLDDDHPESVVVTFELCFEKAGAQHALATDILSFCAFLQPDAIPDELFKRDDSFKIDKTAYKKGIAALLRYSLMKHNAQEKTFSIHRLVQAVLIDDMPSDVQKQWRERVVRVMITGFPYLGFDDWWQGRRLLPHALIFATWTDDELTPTVGIAEFFRDAALYLRQQHSEAETFMARAVSIYKQLLGAEHPHTVRSMYGLAIIYNVQGKYALAKALFQKVLAVQEQLLGAEHPETVICLFMLADAYHELHKYEQSELLYRRAFRILEEYLGAEHPDAVSPLFVFRALLQYLGKHEQADALYQHALSLQKHQLGVRHPYTQETMRAYANFLHRIGHYAEAEALELL